MRKLIPIVFALAPTLVLASPQFSFDGGASSQQMMNNLEQKFNQADANHDGKLTLEEARASMPRLAQHFDDIDTDHRGYITLDQIKTYIMSKRGGG